MERAQLELLRRDTVLMRVAFVVLVIIPTIALYLFTVWAVIGGLTGWWSLP